MSDQCQAGNRSLQASEEIFGEIAQSLLRILEQLGRDAAGGAKCDDRCDVLRSSAAPAFLASTREQRRQIDALTDVKCTDTFRRVELVTGDREEIDPELFYVHRNFAQRLGSVCVHQ